MMLRMTIVAVIAVVAVGACAPANTSATAGCQASASAPWRPLSGVEFTVEASSAGPDCEHAVATLVIRDPSNRILWAEAYPTEFVMTLTGAQDVGAMQTALAEWINSSNNTIATSSAFPEWPANAEAPVSGEFPFYPEPGWERDTYAALRTRDVPVFCFVQGMESMACLALEDGGLDKVGLQTFPG